MEYSCKVLHSYEGKSWILRLLYARMCNLFSSLAFASRAPVCETSVDSGILPLSSRGSFLSGLCSWRGGHSVSEVVKGVGFENLMVALSNFLEMIKHYYDGLWISKTQQFAPHKKSHRGSSTKSQSTYESAQQLPAIPWPPITAQLKATGSMDFATHTFPLLATIKSGTLEAAYTAEEIQKFGQVPAHDVKRYLDALVNSKETKPTVQFKSPSKENYQIWWSGERQRYYECLVDSKGNLSFQVCDRKEPYRLLQKTFGPDKVLKVTFANDQKSGQATIQKLAEGGIFAGLRRYQYWVHKEPDKTLVKLKGKEHSAPVKCYFVCTASLAATDLVDPDFKPFGSIADCRRHIMDIQTTESIAKYQSRLLLALSRTVTVDINFDLQIEKDVHCKDENGRDLDVICTDGTGFISADLASQVPANVTKGVQHGDNSQLGGGPFKQADLIYYWACPAIFQIRIFRNGKAIKGTLGINYKLPPRTIVCRESMLKVRQDVMSTNLPQVDCLELCNTSKVPQPGRLSRDLLLLASALGVPTVFFLGVVQDAIAKMDNKIVDNKSAFNEIRRMTTDLADLARRMLFAGISIKEPYLHELLTKLTSSGWQNLKRGSVELPQSFNLFGTADPTGTLKCGEVAITLGDGPLHSISCPEVAVYKNPGKHPGDVHKLRPTWNKDLQAAVGNSQFALYFSTQGKRPVYEEIGSGDLDGDQYWICKHPEFLFHLQEWPERYVPRPVCGTRDLVRPADLSADELEKKLMDEFLVACFHSRPLKGQAANYWTAHMDLYLTSDWPEEQKMHFNRAMEVGHLFNEAVNCAKSGIQVDSKRLKQLRPKEVPHYLHKTQSSPKRIEGFGTYKDIPVKKTYTSTSVLGQIYDMVERAEQSRASKPEEIKHDKRFDFPGYKKHLSKWNSHFSTYRKEMFMAMRQEKPPGWAYLPTEDDVYLKYRKILFNDLFPEEECTTRVLEEASAIYCLVYRKGATDLSNGNIPRLSFAWKVAGTPLCAIYNWNQLPRDTQSNIYLENQPRLPVLMSYNAYNEIIVGR